MSLADRSGIVDNFVKILSNRLKAKKAWGSAEIQDELIFAKGEWIQDERDRLKPTPRASQDLRLPDLMNPGRRLDEE